MKKQDAGYRMQDAKTEVATDRSPLLYPESRILDPVLMQRMRWRSRRGLLELDIVLGRFIDAHYTYLDESEQLAFEALLDMPDTILWDMIAGRQEAQQSEHQAVLEKIRTL